MTKRRRPGRPPLPKSQRKYHSVSFRMRDGLRKKLERAAVRSVRTLALEIEYRLEQSFSMTGASITADFVDFMRPKKIVGRYGRVRR